MQSHVRCSCHAGWTRHTTRWPGLTTGAEIPVVSLRWLTQCRDLQAPSSNSVTTASSRPRGCRPDDGRPSPGITELSGSRRTRLVHTAAPPCHPEQSTATSRAAQMARIRVSASRPSLLTKTATDTLSTESRFTADRRGIGSESGSRTTSLAMPRMVVVHGATSARRSRGIAASRDSTTTGRRPISAISHHQISPRAGSALTSRQPPSATTPGHPTRRPHQSGARRRRRSSRPPRPIDSELAMRREPHQSGRRQ